MAKETKKSDTSSDSSSTDSDAEEKEAAMRAKLKAKEEKREKKERKRAAKAGGKGGTEAKTSKGSESTVEVLHEEVLLSDVDEGVDAFSPTPLPDAPRPKKAGPWAPSPDEHANLVFNENAGSGKRRSQKESEEYERVLESKIDPTPRSVMLYAEDRDMMSMVKARLADNPGHDLAIHVGVQDRPIYVIFLKNRSMGYVPNLVVLHTGIYSEEDMKNLHDWQEDGFQPNKPSRPSQNSPFISSFKAMLNYPDLEMLRVRGKYLLRRAETLEESGRELVRAEVYALDAEPEEGEAPVDGQQSLRLKIFRNDLGVVLCQLSRVGKALHGTPVEVPGSRITIRPKELENVILCVDEIYTEAYRLACNRQSVYQVQAAEVRRSYQAALNSLLLERAEKEGLNADSDNMVIFNFVAMLLRGKPSATLKRLLNQTRGTKDFFQAFHLEHCHTEQIRILCARLVKNMAGQ